MFMYLRASEKTIGLKSILVDFLLLVSLLSLL